MQSDEQIEAGARVIAATLYYAWDGLPDDVGTMENGERYPDWRVGAAYNPSKRAMRDLARSVLEAALSASTPAPIAGEPVEWCQPNYEGKIHPRKFMVVYEDAEMFNAIFDDEAEAREHFEKASINWNCYLFGLMPRIRSALQPSTEAVLVAWVIPGDDNARDNGSLDAMAWQEGEFSKPLYAASPSTQERIKALEAENERLRLDKEDLTEVVQPLLGCADYASEHDLSDHEVLIVTAGEARESASAMTRIESRAALQQENGQ